MSLNTEALASFTEDDLRATLKRALWLLVIIALAGGCLLLVAAGWQTAALFWVGALISGSGVWEWQKLLGLFSRKLGDAGAPGTTRVVLGFVVRLFAAGAILYVSLRCLHGSVYAILAGLALAAFTLLVEAFRFLRR